MHIRYLIAPIIQKYFEPDDGGTRYQRQQDGDGIYESHGNLRDRRTGSRNGSSLCIKYDCNPRGVGEHITELQQLLLKDDAYIPGIRNEDPADLARGAKVTATSAQEGFAPENVINGISRDEDGHRNLWISGEGRAGGETLSLELAEEQPVSEVHLTFDPNFHYPIKITLSRKRQAQQRIGVPPELVRDYTVALWQGDKKVAEQTVTRNVQRKNIVTFPKTECDRITVTVNQTNGSNEAHIYEVRVYS